MDGIESPVSFGEWLKRRRRALDQTRDELARCVGCSVSALRKIEADERRPSKQLAGLLAGCLEISPDDRQTFVRVARGELISEQLYPAAPLPVANLIYKHPSPAPRINLPTPLTPLVGRQQELAALGELLVDPQCRLVTLVGPGGIGKTRLAIQAAMNQGKVYPNGAYFISLAGLSRAEFIVPAIAEALHFSFRGALEPKTQLLNYLREKELLLVLDNFEHLLAGAGLIAEILANSPGVKLLVTSREQLNLPAEWVFEVEGLLYPPSPSSDRFAFPGDIGEKGEEPQPEDYSAVALFLQSARRARVGYELNADDRQAIVRICQLVDGMPLGIELAAAWARTLSYWEIAREIERNLDFLAAPLRGMPERHRSMGAVFEHSWELLSEQEQNVLRRLSLFRGGFTREAGEQIAAATLPILSGLVSKSLVHQTESGRYIIHELIRQFVAARLQVEAKEDATTHQRHYAFFLELAEAAEKELTWRDQLIWIRRLELEHDNMRAALDWSLANGESPAGKRLEQPLRLASALHPFWLSRGYLFEGYDWMMKALAKGPPVRTALRAQVLARLSMLAYMQGRSDMALSAAEESVSIFRELDDMGGLAEALLAMGGAQLRVEGLLGLTLLEEALGLYREIGDESGIARVLLEIGGYLARLSDPARGRVMVEESVGIFQARGEVIMLSRALNDLGKTTLSQGDYASARTYFEQSLAAADSWGGKVVDIIWAVEGLGLILQMQGDYAAARLRFEEALAISKDLGHRPAAADMLRSLAEVTLAEGNLSAARAYLDECLGFDEVYQSKWFLAFVRRCQGSLAYYEGDRDQSVAHLIESLVLARGVGDYFGLADTLIAVSRVERTLDNVAKALEYLREGLSLCQRLQYRRSTARVLEELAGLTVALHPEQAATLFGAADGIRQVIGAPMPPIERPAYESDLAIVRVQLGELALAGKWAQGKSMPWEQAIEYASAAAGSS